jgi:hypothetical protein
MPRRKEILVQFSTKHTKDDRKLTAGEVVFDRTVYTGIGFAANEALAMLLAVEMRHFGGKESYAAISKKWRDIMKYKDTTKNGVTTTGLTKAADSLEIFTLLAAGTLLIAPMKWMEDRKPQMVKNLNHLFDSMGGNKKTEEEVQARDAEVNKAIACEPKQTWGTMIAGRAIATVSNMGVLKETVFKGERTQIVKDKSRQYADMMADKLHAASGKPAGTGIDRLKQTERFKRYTEIFGLETLYTAASSMVLELSSKFLASKKPRVKNPELCAAPLPQPKAEPKETTDKTRRGFASRVDQSRDSSSKSDSFAQRVVDESAKPTELSL